MKKDNLKGFCVAPQRVDMMRRAANLSLQPPPVESAFFTLLSLFIVLVFFPLCEQMVMLT